MKGYALEANPLSDLLRKTELNDQCLVSFENLMSLLATGPVLRLYDPCAVTEVHKDANPNLMDFVESSFKRTQKINNFTQ